MKTVVKTVVSLLAGALALAAERSGTAGTARPAGMLDPPEAPVSHLGPGSSRTVAASSSGGKRASPDFDRMAADVRELLRELVEANTTNPPGNEAKAVRIGAERLRRAGIEPVTFEFGPGRENLVARLKGTGRLRPLLLLAHEDVVGAEGQPWTVDPHKLTEKDGYLYGRGVADDLGMAATNLVVFLALEESGLRLERDVILAWTGDEESGGAGIRRMLEARPELIDAELALNEGGGPILSESAAAGLPRGAGAVSHLSLQTAEKIYQDYELTTQGPTGHSSVPLADNAIVRLASALERVGGHRFPYQVLDVTRAYYAGRAVIEAGDDTAIFKEIGASQGALSERALAWLESRPIEAANLRTTCVPTLVNGGTRENALPATARANVNCRILPNDTTEHVRQELERVVADPMVKVKIAEDFGSGPPTAFDRGFVETIRRVTVGLWPGAKVIPFTSRGATDSRFLRKQGIAAYGIKPYPMSEEDSRRAHGVDERIPVASLRQGVEYLYRLVVALGGPAGS